MGHRSAEFTHGMGHTSDPPENTGLLEQVREHFLRALRARLPHSKADELKVESTYVDVLNADHFQVVFGVSHLSGKLPQIFYTVQPAAPAPEIRPVEEKDVFAPFPSRVEIPSRQWLAWRHDADPLFGKLPHPGSTVPPEELPEAIRAEALQAGRIVQVERQLIRYRPGTRATYKYWLTRQTGAGQIVQEVYFVKLYRKADRAERYFRNARQIYRLLHRRAVPVRVAEPVALEAEHAMVWYREAPGQELIPREELSEKNACLTDLAESLVEFHTLPMREFQLKDYTPAAELLRVGKIRRKLVETHPEFAALTGEIEQALARTLPAENQTVALLHGTFRTNHVLMSRCCFYFLDLDSLGSGPPEFDLANFHTALLFQALMGRISLSTAQEFGERFLYCYRKFNQTAFRPELYRWYRLDLLFRKQFYKIVRQNNPPPARLVNPIRQEMENALNELS